MFRIITAVFVLLITASTVVADAIDGDWCNASDERLTIIGPQITLPNGKSLTGRYQRHEFAYQVPEGEPDAGQVIYLQLYSDNDMTSFIMKNMQPTIPKNWTRCPTQPKTS